MTKENISHTIEQKESSFGFKTQLASLLAVLSMQYGIAQTNTVNSDTTIKAKTEVVTTNEILSPEKILEKHKISDINTATIEQLQICYKELSDLLKDPEGEEGPKIIGEARKPYVRLRGEIGDLIEDREINKKMEEETNKIKAKAVLSTKMVEALKGKKTEQ